MSDYVDVPIKLENNENGASATIDVTGNPDYEVVSIPLPNGKKGAKAVSVVSGGGTGSEVDPIWVADKPNYATKQLVQDLSPASLVVSTRMSTTSILPTNNLFSLATVDSRINKNGDVYNPPVSVSSSSIVPNFRHVMRRHTYNIGTIASNNTIGVNVLSVAPTIVEPDNLLPETYVGGATPNNDRLWTIPATSGLVNWVLELNIRGNITGTNDADDLLRIELWNGTQVTKVRSILRSQLNDAVNPSGGIDIPFYTNRSNDPMCIATGGFKVLLFNRTGAEITNLVVDMRIKR